MTDDTALREIFGQSKLGVLATIKRDGRPQLTNVTYFYDADADEFRVSITEPRAKAKNLRRDPRATFLVMGPNGGFATAEVAAELTPVAQKPDDGTVEELVDLFRLVQGEHPDWDEYRAAMVADQRVHLRLRVEKVYGTVR